MLVVIVIILRLDVAIPLDDSTDARQFWVWGRSIERDLESESRQADGTVGAGGGEAEGEMSLSRFDYLNQ